MRLEDRYRQLELVRADARERLGAGGRERGQPPPGGLGARQPLARLCHGDEHDLAAAVEAAQELGRPEFTDLALGLARAWEERGHGHCPMPKCCTKQRRWPPRSPRSPSEAPSGLEPVHGTRAVALFELATELAVPAGDPAAEAYATSGTVELMGRFGCYADSRCDPEATSPLARAFVVRGRSGRRPCSRARALLARTWRRDWEAPDVERMGLDAERSLLAARECGDMATLSSGARRLVLGRP